ncbi:MAG: c-type cytochrome [Lysobacter sp.]|nr:c-type cytochrome [Lysobacter sp.]
MRPLRPCWIGLGVLPLAGCDGAQSALAPAGDQAEAIGRLWDLTLAVCVLVYVLVLLALAWALRRRGRRRATDERAMTKALVAFVLFTGGTLTLLTVASFVTDRRLHAPVRDPLHVRITASQWWWQVEYLSADPSRQLTTANELHLPVDRPVRIELATTDVIHSLWIPVLAGKQDLIPGHHNVLVVTPRHVGRYRGQCAEFCGLQHAHMALDVQVDGTEDFAAWYAHQLQPAPTPRSAGANAGQRLFAASACAMCHAIGGTDAGGRVGPDLTHLASRRTLAAGALPLDRTRLAAWILDPQRYKPGTNMPQVPLQPQQLDQVTDYLMELQ